jgi:hypothetical protein
MSTKITLENSLTTIQNIPEELLLLIFQSLDLAGCLTARRVCQLWAQLGKDPTTIFGHYFAGKTQIEKLVTLAPRLSAWEQMLGHLGLHNHKKMVEFSSITPDILSFFPPFYMRNPKFFSLKRLLSFSRYPISAEREPAYALTPPDQKRLQLDLETDLKLLASHVLIVKNAENSNEDLELSRLCDLPETTGNLSTCIIEHCLPISEDKVAIITGDKTISLWDLKPLKPICYKRLQAISGSTSNVYKLDDHLLVEDKLIHLKDLSIVKQDFNDKDCFSIRTFGSFVLRNKNKQGIEFFALSESGLLEEKWNFTIQEGLIEPYKGKPALHLLIEGINENFIVLSSWHENAVNLLVLNMDGKQVHLINAGVLDKPIKEFDYEFCNYSLFTRISGNILVFKHPQKHTLYFWHISMKKCLQEFEWTKAVKGLTSSLEDAKVRDIYFADGKLTILVSDISAQFRMIQFGSLSTEPSKLLEGLINRVFTVVRGLYYATPGENPT